MGLIKVLPDTIANKIAAGEVVERPASVAKELLENALDAGATHLHIDVEAGGRRRLQVTDNGRGMGRDDALLAFERHATSKLREVHDLLSISTLGFRGEALPSIASVSRLLLETRSTDEDLGTRVEIAGGRIISVTESSFPAGTTVTMRDLFYNVPARRKFLRAEKTELAHITSLVTHYSLAHIDKFFSLAHERGALLNVTPVETLRERVYQVFGPETLEQLVEVAPVTRQLQVMPTFTPPSQTMACESTDQNAPKKYVLSLQGFISVPQVQKRNRNSIYIFVNGRLIRDRILLKAISNAYHNLIPPGCFPFALLFLDLPFAEVDVNVHPSKTEVRFHHHSLIHDFVRDSLRERLMVAKPVSTFPVPAEIRTAQGHPGTVLSRPETSLTRSEDDIPLDAALSVTSSTVPPSHLNFDTTTPIEVQRSTLSTSASPLHTVTSLMPRADNKHMPSQSQAEAHEVLSEHIADSLPIDSRTHSGAPLMDLPRDTMANLGQLRPLGQIRNSFIVASDADGLWIIDQHVAHERILFEQILRQRSQGTVGSQRLLMPIIVTLKPDQEIKFAQIEKELRANGFDIEPFGQRTVAVKAAPSGFSPQNVEILLHEIFDTPEKELRALSLSDLQRRVSATIACHAAIKVNMPLDLTKMHWILDQLAKSEFPMTCPHGRPIALKYSLREILRAFHRI